MREVDKLISRPSTSNVSIGLKRRFDTEPSIAEESSQILQLLKLNGIKSLYHFTAVDNLDLIKKRGGLFSWSTMLKLGWEVPIPGSEEISRSLDLKLGLSDYVRLSFCKVHPMSYRLLQKGVDVAILTIDIEVATLEGVLFSDKNAVARDHKRAAGLKGVRLVNFAATQREYVRREDPDFPYLQAEILIPKHIPIKYIKELNNDVLDDSL